MSLIAVEQISRVQDRTQTPDPSADVHWWVIDVGEGRRPGWVKVAGSVSAPSNEWIAEELGRQAHRFGRALEGRLLAKGGLDLTAPAREAARG